MDLSTAANFLPYYGDKIDAYNFVKKNCPVLLQSYPDFIEHLEIETQC